VVVVKVRQSIKLTKGASLNLVYATGKNCLASLSGKCCKVSSALSAYAHASSLVRSTPDDRRTRSRAWTPRISQRHRQQMQSTYELDISLLFELSSDEDTHLGVFFPCVQRWTRRQSQL
jgi:hypothetical protein